MAGKEEELHALLDGAAGLPAAGRPGCARCRLLRARSLPTTLTATLSDTRGLAADALEAFDRSAAAP